MSRNNWNKHDQSWKIDKSQRPPGLKGREIGLYYKNLKKGNKEAKKKSKNIVSTVLFKKKIRYSRFQTVLVF